MAEELPEKVNAGDFYATYHGHIPAHLRAVQTRLRDCAGVSRFIYLAGDSSLDNKHWFFDGWGQKENQLGECSDFVGQALNGYQAAIDPPHMVMDVSYWLNEECERRREAASHEASGSAPSAGAKSSSPVLPTVHTACLNCAIEESCIVQRELQGLQEQDEYIRDNITENDVLVVDVGGNDVALHPTLGVQLNMAWLLYLTPEVFIKTSPFLAPGTFYFIYMFRVRLRRYIERLISKKKPRKVVVCMLYFLDETPGGSWADGVLHMLGYDSNPSKLQAVMRQVYAWGVSQIHIPGTEVVPLPLYEALNGKDTADYKHRVEPSVAGGKKMAAAIASKVFD
eukprot:TRINITY_DN34719_c0_g1_i1.p1 TRINITY_DN34719_c0_g1~~TRINITY_DN34719_c0_g1_i1.p1  ORF type:complete len:339 (-),score=50.62 TRINITY_DN34719_c0_g1_i1:137-1153(-)